MILDVYIAEVERVLERERGWDAGSLFKRRGHPTWGDKVLSYSKK